MTTSATLPIRTVLVTGAAGYIGSVASRRFLDAGLNVIGIDTLEFGVHGLQAILDHPRFRLVQGDVRRVDDWINELAVSDAVLHLAAIVGDPACAQQPGLATSVNVEATRRLLHEARRNAVTSRFIFASTCSNYGRHPDYEYCDESSELRPLSLYAETKVEMEREILAAPTTDDFTPTCLRFATAFGLSPRMRFDLTVNEFARELAEGRELEVFGEQFWRPYCHTEDISAACLTVLGAPPEAVRSRAFNVGSTANNHTKKELVELLRAQLPGARVKFVRKEEDPRSYKVNCDRIERELGYRARHTVQSGISEILAALAGDAWAGIPDNAFRNSVAA